MSSLPFFQRRSPRESSLVERIEALEARLDAELRDSMLAHTPDVQPSLATNGAHWDSPVIPMNVIEPSEQVAILGALELSVTPTVVAAAALSWTVAVIFRNRTLGTEREIWSATIDERATSLVARRIAPIAAVAHTPGVGRHEYRVRLSVAITAASTMTVTDVSLGAIARRTR